MANRRNESAGGIFLAIGALGGVLIGRIYGQTSIGLLAGLAIGAGLVTIIWWRGRKPR